jgi:hypothetical protein
MVEMATAIQSGHVAISRSTPEPAPMQAFFSIAELAQRWRCSRGTVYNVIRGEKVLDFAAPGHRGKKLVPQEVVRRIEQSKMRVWR